jgi:hypothetical protein
VDGTREAEFTLFQRAFDDTDGVPPPSLVNVHVLLTAPVITWGSGYISCIDGCENNRITFQELVMEKNIITILLFDFLIAVAVGIAASAIVAFIIANVAIGLFKRSWRQYARPPQIHVRWLVFKAVFLNLLFLIPVLSLFLD